jgi:hypothetical protein
MHRWQARCQDSAPPWTMDGICPTFPCRSLDSGYLAARAVRSKRFSKPAHRHSSTRGRAGARPYLSPFTNDLSPSSLSPHLNLQIHMYSFPRSRTINNLQRALGSVALISTLAAGSLKAKDPWPANPNWQCPDRNGSPFTPARAAKSNLILAILGFAGIESIAATNRPSAVISAGEIRTAHLAIVDNHGKVLTETEGVDGEIHIKRYAPQVRSY